MKGYFVMWAKLWGRDGGAGQWISVEFTSEKMPENNLFRFLSIYTHTQKNVY